MHKAYNIMYVCFRPKADIQHIAGLTVCLLLHISVAFT